MSTDKAAEASAFHDLELALKDALGEVERSAVLFNKQGGQLSMSDWMRTKSTVHAVGDKLRDLDTLRNESPVPQRATESVPRPSGAGQAYLITKGPNDERVDVPFEHGDDVPF
jgi:hypothetical protein